MPEKARPGDKVIDPDTRQEGKVVKVKPDGTRVFKDRTGTLQRDDNPPKAPSGEDDEA